MTVEKDHIVSENISTVQLEEEVKVRTVLLGHQNQAGGWYIQAV